MKRQFIKTFVLDSKKTQKDYGKPITTDSFQMLVLACFLLFINIRKPR